MVVAVGRVKERGLREVLDDYARRIGHYTSFEEVEIEDGPAEAIVRSVTRAAPAATVIPLDASGRGASSREFSALLERWGSHGKGHVAFVIGGRDGLSEQILRPAKLVLSLSAMTLPHRLARVVLFEQIYRGLTLLRGEPYGA